MSYRLTKQALADIDHIAVYTQEQHPEHGERIGRAFEDCFELLAHFPKLGRSGPRPGTREFPMRQYPFVVIFRVGSGVTEILRVYHMARVRK